MAQATTIASTAIRSPSDDLKNHTTILRQLKETTEIAQRLRGDPLDSFVRLRELVNINIVRYTGAVQPPTGGSGFASVSTTITGIDSITGGGDLSANRTLQLVNDSASPGNNKVYGTNGSGVKGWQAAGAGSGTVTSVGITGSDFTITGSPVTTTGNIGLTIANNVVTNAKLAQMGAHTFKGNNTAATANAADLTATQLTAELNVFTSALKGLAPLSGGGTANYLRADGTWAAPPGATSGTVTSVGVTSTDLSVSGSPVTTTGSITLNINANAVTNAKLAQMATLTIKGNNTGGTANAADLTVAQVNLILPVFTSTLNGSVPLSGGGTTNFLRADGTWAVPAGSGGTPANPTASVGLAAVNGVATTYMRSDAAPALSQAIAPTWTGAHTFSGNVVTINGNGSLAAAYGPAIGIATNIAGANQSIFFGDGSGYVFTLSARTGSVSSDWLTYNDTGHAVFHSPTTGTALTVNAVTGGSSGFVVTDGTVKIDHFFGTGVGLFGTSTNHPLRIVANSANRLIIDPAAGVQVSAPPTVATALDVRGNGNIEIATFTASTGNAAYIGIVDGQTGNFEWLIASGLVAPGVFAIDGTPGAVLFCNQTGQWNFSNCNSATAPAVTINGFSTTQGLQINAPVAANPSYMAYSLVSVAKAYMGVSAGAGNLNTGSVAGDTCIRADAGRLLIATNGSTTRIIVDTSGQTTISPTGGVALTLNGVAGQATLIVKNGNSSSVGIRISDPGANTTTLDLDTTNAEASIRASGTSTTLGLYTAGTLRISVSAAGATSFALAIGVNGSVPPAKVTGWGTPTTPTVVANFSGSAGTLVNCSNAIAKIITDLKNLGFYGV